MSKKDVIIKEVRGICNQLALSLKYDLVDVEFVKEFGSYFLRVYIDKPGGVNLDDCQAMSEMLSEKLDEKDPIGTAYYLEVSSPGLDRPLKTDKDLDRNIGKDIEINLYTALNNKKKYEGNLKQYDENYITITDDKDNITEVPREAISLIRLSVKF